MVSSETEYLYSGLKLLSFFSHASSFMIATDCLGRPD